MKVLMLIIICLLTAGVAGAEDKNKWTTLDTGLQLTYATVHVMDWCQTLHAVRRRKINYANTYVESNSILGEHPNKKKVNTYFASTLILHSAIAYVLPKPYRTIWQSLWIGIEYETIQDNRRVGLGVSFYF